MTQVNIPTPFGASVGTAAQQLLSANASRKFLQVQNQSTVGAIVTVKFDSTFTPARNGVQVVKFSPTPDAGAFTLEYDGTSTAALPFNANAAAVTAALEANASIGGGGVVVAGSMAAGYTVTFGGALADMAVLPITVSSNTLTDSTLAQSTSQLISFSHPPTTGLWELQDKLGNSTPALAWDISAVDLATALNALPAINGGIDSITQDPISKAFSISFAGAPLTDTSVPLLLLLNSTLESTTAQLTGVQKFYASPAPLQGTFKLGYKGKETTALAYNASSATVQTALRALSTIGAGNVTVAGSMTAGYTFTFAGALAGTAVDLIVVTDNSLHPDILQEPQKRVADDLHTRTYVTVVGHGVDTVVGTVAFLQAGIDPAPAVGTVTITVLGNSKPSEGMSLAAGESLLYTTAIPVGSVWAVSTVAATPVQVWEG